MAPGPPDRQSNRFAILGDYLDQNINFPILPPVKTNIINDPKYLIISSKKDNELKKLSPFIIQKGLHSISTLIDSISQLRDGNLLLLVRNQVIADKFLKAKSLLNICEITVKLHETLNFVKGVIYAPCLIDVSEEEIVKELKDQGVVSVYKYTFTKEDGTKQCNGYMVLTFNLYNLPKTIDVAWYKVKVKTYFPNPMRCRNCQLLGHTKNKCGNPASCDNCNLPPHQPAECTRQQCANCSDKHPASDKNCPRYIQQKEIIKIKTIDKCSFGAAKRKYEITANVNSKQPENQSYSETTKNNDNSKNVQNKQIQKRVATSPKTKNQIEKLPRRESLSSSSSIEMDVDATPSSTTTKSQNSNKEIKKLTNPPKHEKSTKNQQQSNKTKTTTITPTTTITTPTTSTTLTEELNKNRTFTITSPLGKLTQDLMTTQKYFITKSDTDIDLDD